MPEISRFFGIIIAMYYDDHAPPHFHARYGNQKAVFSIEEFAVLKGRLSPKALSLVLEWAALHKQELMEDWALAQQHVALKPIQPLE